MRLSVHDAAYLLGVSTKTIYRWIGDGKLPGYRVAGQYRFDRTEIIEWATSQRMPVSSALLQEHLEVEPVPNLAEALSSGGIHYRVHGRSRDEVLRVVVDTLRVGKSEERDALFEAIRARERLASTAIGGGLALPHLRNPLRLQIDRPLVALCFLEVAVDWYAPDHTPVTALAVVLASTVRAVLQLHSRALFALQDPGFRRAVLDASARDVLLAEAARVSLLQRPHPQEDEP